MKRLLSVTLALTLLGSSVAMAHDYRGEHGGYATPYRYGYRDRDNGAAALGFGLLALGAFAAIASSAQHDRYYDDGYYAPPPPPPPPAYGYGYGYGPGYGYAPPPAYGPSFGFSYRSR